MADREVKLTYKISDDGTLRVLDDVKLKVRQVGEEAERSTTQAATGFSKFQASIVTLNQGLALARQVAGEASRVFNEFAVQPLQAIDSFAELSKAVGLSVSDLTSLRVAAKQGGLELSELGRMVAFLQRNIVQSAGGGGKLKLFEQLGISQEDLRAVSSGARSTISVLEDLGEAFDGLSKAQEVAFSRELFGRGGGRVLNVLTGNLREQIGVARELGAVITDDMAGAADEAANALDEMSVAVESAKEAIGLALAPVVRDIASNTRDWAAANREVVASDILNWVSLLRDALGGLQSIGELPVLAQLRELNLLIAGGALRAVGAIGSTIDARASSAAGALFGGSAINNPDAIVGVDSRAAGGDAYVQRLLRRAERLRQNSAQIEALRSENVNGGEFTPAGVFGDPFSGTGLPDPYGFALPGIAGPPAPPARRGGGAGRATSARQVQDDDRRALEAANESERIRLALVQQQVELRNVSIEQAKEDLSLARESGTSQEQQLQLASRLDELERLRLVTMRERIQAELDGLLQFGPALSAEVVDLQTQLYVVDQQLSRAPEHAARMREEFERAGEAVFDLGVTLNSSLQRAVDGLLSGGGNFNFSNVILGTLRAQTSTLVGDAIQNFDFGSLFGAGGGQIDPNFVGPPTEAQAASAGGDALGGAGGLAAAAVTFGATVALDLALNGSNRVKELFRNTNTLRKTLDSGDIVNAFGGGGLIGGLGELFQENPALDILFAGGQFGLGIFQPPTGGSQRARALDRILTAQGLPQQSFIARNERGIRSQFLTNAPTAATAAAFAAAGFGFDIPGLQQPTIDELRRRGANGATFARNPTQLDALSEELASAAAANPGVERLRTADALGLGLVLTGGTRRGVNVANLLTNNLLLTGVSEGEARRQLRKIAESQGVSLTGGVEEANRLFIEGRLRDDPNTASNEAQRQLLTSVEGLVSLFQDDIPAGVDVTALAVANFTEKAGIDIDKFNRELERALEIFGQLESTIEGGLRSGLGAGVSSLANRNALIAGGGSISDIIKANLEARQDVISSLFDAIRDGFTTAITEGVFDAVKETPAWKALSDVIAGAVSGGDLASLPNLVGDVLSAALPALESAASAVEQINRTVGVTPTALRQSGQSIDDRIRNTRFGQLNPTQQDAFLRRELGDINRQLADPTLSPTERKRLLDRRAEIAFQGADIAASRFAPGSAAGERAVNEWLLIAEDTANRFEQFGIDQMDAITSNTSALDRNTEALERNTAATSAVDQSNTTVVVNGEPGNGFATTTRVTQAVMDFVTLGTLPPAVEAQRRRRNRRP